MSRTALLHLLRSQTNRLSSRSFRSGYQVCRSGTSWSNSPSVKPNLNPFINIGAVQKRWASLSSVSEDEGKTNIGSHGGESPEEEKKDAVFVYHGAASSLIKKVKVLSLSSCFFAVALGPAVVFMTSPDLHMLVKVFTASTVMGFSITTTAALNWFVTPYIHKLKWQPGSDSFEVEMLSWLATRFSRTIKFADIQPPETMRPMVTFEADGKFYYIDAETCQNKALLAKINAAATTTGTSATETSTGTSASKNL